MFEHPGQGNVPASSLKVLVACQLARCVGCTGFSKASVSLFIPLENIPVGFRRNLRAGKMKGLSYSHTILTSLERFV